MANRAIVRLIPADFSLREAEAHKAMHETYMYRGHAIDLELQDVLNEQIRWTYFIDKSYCMQGALDSQLGFHQFPGHAG